MTRTSFIGAAVAAGLAAATALAHGSVPESAQESGRALAQGGAEESASVWADVAFLQGAWRGGDGFVFEEIWSAPAGGVMTGMARGYDAQALRVLEYIIIAETGDGLEMRFKHFNADYSTWEDGGPVTLRLTEARAEDVTFSADPPSETVSSVRYWKPAPDRLQADVVVVEDGEEGGFSLSFVKSSVATD